ncbi:MAG: acetyl-CoA synthase [Pseudomonadota bacterium]
MTSSDLSASTRDPIYRASPDLIRNAQISTEDYATAYRRSLDDPEGFWGEKAREWLVWEKPFSQVRRSDFSKGEIAWFEDGTLNASVNCLDRHLPVRRDQPALLWEGDHPDASKVLTYGELFEAVCRLANVLKDQGVRRGDRVCIYLPMIPEGTIAMLACARIGAVHSVVFGGFSAEALRDRIEDSGCRLVICADQGLRGGRAVPLKANVDEALSQLHLAMKVLVVRHTRAEIAWDASRDLDYSTLVAAASPDCPAEAMGAEDPLFILYTSGSTGRPKGVVHTTGGYLLQAVMTHRLVFDYREGEIYWCSADYGWITGHSYVVYGPLGNGATTLVFEGVPTYPNPGRFWQTIEKYGVNIFYTAPTAIRALMGSGNHWVHESRLESLRVLGSVGEPINPEAWNWFYHVVGDSRCPIVDTWWQTETGGIMITPLVGAIPMKPGSATRPFLGVDPVLVDEKGTPIEGPGEGILLLRSAWPGQARTLFKDHTRFKETYLRPFPGYYFTGDGARRDQDGYYWITGRVDDVINIAGHRLGTAEIESALVLHPAVVEAAVVGYPHPIKGQGIYAFVTLGPNETPSPELRKALVEQVRHEIGAIASPQVIQWAPALPKTRSGKIMRRILRKIASDESEQLGDLSTLADPDVVRQLIASHPQAVAEAP